MSLIGKKPFVQEIFAAMTDEHLETLNSLINNLGEPEFVNFNEIGEANLGVHYVRLTFNELYMNSHFGFLIYVDNEHCGFFSFQDYFEEMKSVKIDPVSHQYWYLQEHLTADEFRRALADALENGGSGPSGSSVNIITFSDVVLSDNVAELSITDEDWTKMQDTTKDCVVVIEYISGSKTALNRMTLSTFRIIFSSMRPYSDDQLEEVTATFERYGMDEPYTYQGELKISYFEASGGLPVSTKADQVLVSNSEGGWDEKKSAPLADNLLGEPITNDAMYSSGPTGGLADITTGEEAYLQEIKGMTIVWNQLVHGDGTDVLPFTSTNVIIYFNSLANTFTLYNGNGYFGSFALGDKIFDLTLMFGGNDKIPFSLNNETEYPANGTIPAQTITAVQRFQRLFANIDLTSAPYDAGTIKNVKVTKLVETGRNLWDSSMETDGLLLLAGYRYEIYYESSNPFYAILAQNPYSGSFGEENLTRYQRADGKYVFTYTPGFSRRIKPKSGYHLAYVGFVHSGNYCLTTGTVNNAYSAYTDVTIPTYHKYEFTISGIDGLNGLLDSNGKVSVYDTKDYRRIASIDLSTLTWTDLEDGYWSTPALQNSNIDAIENGTCLFTNPNISKDASTDEELILYSPDGSPTGTFLYPLTEPVATGESAFEPIALKSGDTWIVDDMGSEYFIQPANTNCPVNQVSYYYENLKDKLQNLPEPIEVTSASYSDSNTILTGIKIGSTTYALLPWKTSTNRYSYGIGYGANTYTTMGSVALGHNSSVISYHYGVALGYSSYVQGSYSIALGTESRNYIPESATSDAQSRSVTWHYYSPEYIFFRNEYSGTKSSFASYTSGHFLSEYIQLQTLEGTWAGGGFTSTKTFLGDEINGVEIVISFVDTTNLVSENYSGILLKPDLTHSVTKDISLKTGEVTAYINISGNIEIDATDLTNLNDYDVIEVKYHLL